MGKNILLGVTGGIAAYKAADLSSILVQKGHTVRVIMTESAKKIITPMTLATLSRQPVYDDAAEWAPDGHICHIELSKWANLFVVCPATANTIAKMAYGIADNLLTSAYLALSGRRVKTMIFPAMNTKMWESEQTQGALTILKSRYLHTVIDPVYGMLACGEYGIGKLPSTKDVVEAISQQLIEFSE